MAVFKTVNYEPPREMRIGRKRYKYQYGTAFLSDAEDSAKKWRKQGLFVKIVKYQKRGHPVGKPKMSYRPAYFVYISPKKTKKQPSWYKG